MEEGCKRVLGIMASILVARHLQTTEDLHDNRPSPRTESLVASAVQWADVHGRTPAQDTGSLPQSMWDDPALGLSPRENEC